MSFILGMIQRHILLRVHPQLSHRVLKDHSVGIRGKDSQERRTWGGLVGILGFPVLLDGGTITAPNFAIWTPQEGWVVENIGVPPDIEVEMLPAEVMAGHDPQLEKAVEVLMADLKKSPPARPNLPAYPNKVVP